MKLSEAIFLGSKLSGQAFGVMVDQQGNRCAFGAAHEAAGLAPCYGVRDEWRWLDIIRCPCPECGDRLYAGVIVSLHLNDRHRWTRERIADWVASIEPVEAVSTQSEVMAPVCTEPAEMLHR